MPRRVAPAAELGIDVSRTSGASVNVWLRSYKADGRNPYILCGTLADERLALYLEYHPDIAYYQRADVKESFLRDNRLVARIPVPFVMPYEYEGGSHDYYVDFVALLTSGHMSPPRLA